MSLGLELSLWYKRQLNASPLWGTGWTSEALTGRGSRGMVELILKDLGVDCRSTFPPHPANGASSALLAGHVDAPFNASRDFRAARSSHNQSFNVVKLDSFNLNFDCIDLNSVD